MFTAEAVGYLRPHRRRLAARTASALAMLSMGALAATPAPVLRFDDIAITIYSSARPGAIPPELYRPLPGQGVPDARVVPGYAMVRHERDVQLVSGRSQLRFADVAALIDPTTVTFASLTDPAARVLEQDFQFDLVSTDKLLLKYLDKPIAVERDRPGGGTASTHGTLLSSAGGLVLRGSDGNITALRNYPVLAFPDLPGGLITRPTLMWNIASDRGGDQRARVNYQTGGITWWADYNLIFSAGSDASNGFVDLTAWVSVINQSGATYPDARLKLVAGEVNRAPQPAPDWADRSSHFIGNTLANLRGLDPGFTEKAFDEFHLYTLGRRTTLPDNSTKQIELFDKVHSVPARRLFVLSNANLDYYPNGYTDRAFPYTGNNRVDAYLEFRNDKASGLGLPLPAGRIRVSRLDTADRSLEFIGEDAIAHTPRDEQVRVKLGAAFDVVGERRQVDFHKDSGSSYLEEEVEVEVRNHKDEDVEVQVREFLFRWTNWHILASNHGYSKEDARTVMFLVHVPANGSNRVRYRVRYSW